MSEYQDVWEILNPESVQPEPQPTLRTLRRKKEKPVEIPSAGYTFDSAVNNVIRQYEQVDICIPINRLTGWPIDEI